MRRFCTGLLAGLLALGLLAAEPVSAKVYKMDPEERAAALKEKKAKRHKAKKSGKAEPGQDQGGWVEVKPGEQVAKRSRKAKAAEAMDPAKKKSRKHKKAVEETPPAENKPSKAEKKTRKAKTEEVAEPSTKKSRKHKKAVEETAQLERKSAKAEKKSRKAEKVEKAGKTEAKAEKRSGKKGRRSASRGDRAIGSGYSGEQKVSASSAEVRRPADDLSAYSVSRPGQHQQKAAPAVQTPAPQTPSAQTSAPQAPAAVPEVRKEVQPGPLDTSTPVGTELKTGEGRF
jgi:ribonuclease E